MKLDGKAANLVLHLRQCTEKLAVGLEADGGRWETVEQFAGAVAVILSEARNGDGKPQFVFDHLANDFHLPPSTVRND